MWCGRRDLNPGYGLNWPAKAERADDEVAPGEVPRVSTFIRGRE